MSWLPGVGPVKDISAVGVRRGLSEDWYSDTEPHKTNRKEIKKGSFWDIIDNPLYEVAAGAAGFNWAEWVAEAKGTVGTGPDDGTQRVRAVIKAGRPAGRRAVRYKDGTSYQDVPGTPTEYEWMTKDEANERGLAYEEGNTTRWKNKDTGEIIIGHPRYNDRGVSGRGRGRTFWGDSPYSGMSESQAAGAGVLGIGSLGRGRGDDYDDWEELRDWGSFDEDINEDLDEMQRWLHDIVSINDHLPKIIREGPKGEHYGIEGDIWEHYGLDEEPEPPKELEWDSYDKKMQLATAVESTVGYSTPEGITPVDLHGD